MTWDTGCGPSVKRLRSEQKNSWRCFSILIGRLDCVRAVAGSASQAMLAVAARIGQWVLMGPTAMHDHRLCAAFREHRSYRGGRAALRKIGFRYRYQHLPCEKLRVVLRWALVSGFQLASFSISTFWFWAAMARPCTEGIEPILWRPCLGSLICAIEHQWPPVHVNVMAVHVDVMVPKDVGHSVPWGKTWHVLAGLVFCRHFSWARHLAPSKSDSRGLFFLIDDLCARPSALIYDAKLSTEWRGFCPHYASSQASTNFTIVAFMPEGFGGVGPWVLSLRHPLV